MSKTTDDAYERAELPPVYDCRGNVVAPAVERVSLEGRSKVNRRNRHFVEIILEPVRGVTFDVAVEKAVRLAMNQRIRVFLRFNGVDYRITPELIVGLVAERLKQHGPTAKTDPRKSVKPVCNLKRM